jgi:hypothetical protein
MPTIKLKSGNKTISLHTTEKSVSLQQKDHKIELRQVGLRGLPGEGDKNFIKNFTNLAEVTVVHGLNKRPAISIENSAGDEVEADVKYIDPNTMKVQFSSSFTGRIICN